VIVIVLVIVIVIVIVPAVPHPGLPPQVGEGDAATCSFITDIWQHLPPPFMGEDRGGGQRAQTGESEHKPGRTASTDQAQQAQFQNAPTQCGPSASPIPSACINSRIIGFILRPFFIIKQNGFSRRVESSPNSHSCPRAINAAA